MCMFRRLRRLERLIRKLLLAMSFLFIFINLAKLLNKHVQVKKQQEMEKRMAALEERIARLEAQHQ